MQASWGVCLGRARGAAGVTTRFAFEQPRECLKYTAPEHLSTTRGWSYAAGSQFDNKTQS